MDTQRVNRAITTPQYALDQLEVLASVCVDKLTSLSASVGVNRLVETYWWRELNGCYSHARQTMDYLRQAGLSDGSSDRPFAFKHSTFMINAISGKIEKSVAMDATENEAK